MNELIDFLADSIVAVSVIVGLIAGSAYLFVKMCGGMQDD